MSERIVPPLAVVHCYRMARELVKDRDVLDLQSGPGHGPSMLAETARSVVAVHLSPDVLGHAARHDEPGVQQLGVDSGDRLPLPDASVDVVVSLGPAAAPGLTLHAMAEIRRVLRPGGVLIASCRDEGQSTRSLDGAAAEGAFAAPPDPFQRRVLAHFRHAVFYRQRMVYGSALVPAQGHGDIVWYGERSGAPRDRWGPRYRVAIASDEPLAPVPASFCEDAGDEGGAFARADEEESAWTGGPRSAHERREAAVTARARLEELEAQLSWTEERLAELLGSTSWRITAAVRGAGRAARRLRSALRAGVRVTYRALPLPVATKLKIRARVFSLLTPGPGGLVTGLFARDRAATAIPGLQPSDRFADPRTPFRPAVTVIVPNYNHEPFLRQRLESVYRQSYRNFRVILLDDGSTDGSRAILEDYARAHADVTELHVNAGNSGRAFVQWQKGIRLAQGELIWIAESDDYCDETFLEAMIEFFSDEAVQLAYCRTVFVDSSGQPLSFTFEQYLAELDGARWRRSHVETAHDEVRKALGRKNSIPNVSGVVFRRPETCRILEDEHWQRLRLCGDWIFYLHVARGGKIGFGRSTVNYHRFHTDNVTVAVSRSDAYCREHAVVAGAVARLYDVPGDVLQAQRQITQRVWRESGGGSEPGGSEFDQLYDRRSVTLAARGRRPNILMVGFGFCTGGGEIFPIRLAAALKDRGYGVTFFDFHGEEVNPRIRSMLPSDIPVVERNRRLGSLDAVLDRFGIELVHTHHASAELYVATSLHRGRGRIKHVATMHGMYETQDASTLDANLPAIMKSVDRWGYLSEKNLEPFRTRGWYREDLFVKIANGLTPVVARPVDRRALGLAREAFVLCLASRAIPEKGWHEAIEITRMARRLSGEDIHLVLLGDGPVREELRRTSLPSFIHLLGYRDNPIDYYAMADLGLLPSRFKGESAPLSVIECAIADRPVVASDVGEVRDMLTVGGGHVAGRVFPLQDWTVPIGEVARIIAQYARDEEAYAAAQMRAREVAARFSMKAVVDAYTAVYDTVLGSRSPRADGAGAR